MTTTQVSAGTGTETKYYSTNYKYSSGKKVILFFILRDMLAECEGKKHVSSPSGKPMFRSQTCQVICFIFHTLPESVLTGFSVRWWFYYAPPWTFPPTPFVCRTKPMQRNVLFIHREPCHFVLSKRNRSLLLSHLSQVLMQVIKTMTALWEV